MSRTSCDELEVMFPIDIRQRETCQKTFDKLTLFDNRVSSDKIHFKRQKMAKNRLIVLVISVMLSIGGFFLHAYELSLEESIESALENNKQLQAEKKSKEIAVWQKRSALTNFLPKVNLNTSAVRIDDSSFEQATEIFEIPVLSRDPVNPFTEYYVPFSAAALQGIHQTSYRSNITVTQPLFLGGKIALSYRISSLASDISEKNYTQQINELTYQVAYLYFNILKLNEMQDITQKSIESANVQLATIQQKKELGMARKTDVLQWRVRLQEHHQTLIEVQDNLKVLTDLWSITVGQPNRYPAPINTEKVLTSINSMADYDPEQSDEQIQKIIDQVMTGSPWLSITNISKDINRLSYRMAQGNFLPNLNLQFNYEIDDGETLDFSGNKSWNIAAVLSIPLFNGGANYTQLQVAKKELRQAEIASLSVMEMLENEAIRLARNQMRSAKAVKNSELNLELTRQNYNNLIQLLAQEMLTSRELLDAENMLRAAQMQHISSIYDFIVSKYELIQLGANKDINIGE